MDSTDFLTETGESGDGPTDEETSSLMADLRPQHVQGAAGDFDSGTADVLALQFVSLTGEQVEAEQFGVGPGVEQQAERESFHEDEDGLQVEPTVSSDVGLDQAVSDRHAEALQKSAQEHHVEIRIEVPIKATAEGPLMNEGEKDTLLLLEESRLPQQQPGRTVGVVQLTGQEERQSKQQSTLTSEDRSRTDGDDAMLPAQSLHFEEISSLCNESLGEGDSILIRCPHSSIMRSFEGCQISMCSDTSCSCGGHKTAAHCELCPSSRAWTNKTAVSQHFLREHWDQRIQVNDDFNLALCHCGSQLDSALYHYHCPSCGATVPDIETMSSHLPACISAESARPTLNVGEVKDGQSDVTEAENTKKGLQSESDDQNVSTSPALLQEKLGKNYHKTIVGSLSDIRLEPCQTCCKGTHYHCPICPDILCRPQVAAKMQHHITSSHWKFRVQHEDMFVLKCTGPCLGMVNGRPLAPHWHCPLCARKVCTRQTMTAHLAAHHRGTHQRRRTNAEWAAMLGPDDAGALYNLPKERERLTAEGRMGDGSSEDAPSVGKSDENEEMAGKQEDGSHAQTKCEDKGTSADECTPMDDDSKQVFQTVAALLSQRVLSAIPGRLPTYFARLQEEEADFQFTTTNQWCLLQGDWGTMGRVHDRLTRLLEERRKDPPGEEDTGRGDTGQSAFSGASQDEVGDLAGSSSRDGKVTKAAVHNTPTATTTGDDETPSELADNEPEGERTSESPMQNMDEDESNQPPASSPSGNTSPKLGAESPTTGQSMDKPVCVLPDGNGFSSRKTRFTTKVTAAVIKPPLTDKTRTEPFLTSRALTSSEPALTSQEEARNHRKSIPTTDVKDPVPVKRGRGRPRKVASVAPSVVAASPPLGRRKARMPRRFQDYDVEKAEENSSEMDDTEEEVENSKSSAASPTPTVTTVDDSNKAPVPVKRGRGRPRKYPLPTPPATTNTEQSGSRTDVQKDDSSDKREQLRTVDNNEEEDYEVPTKRCRRDDSDAPAIIISLDETTGDFLSLSVNGDSLTGGKVDPPEIDKSENADHEQTDLDLEDEDAAGSISLVPTKKVVACPACGRGYREAHRYYQHLLGTACISRRQRQDKQFVLPPDLDALLKTVQHDVTTPQCPLCGKSFRRVLHAQMHYAEKTCMHSVLREKRQGLEINKETGLVHCRHCDFAASSLQRVLMHEMRKHWAKTEHCPICRKSYSSAVLLREHIKAVHAKGKERTVCDQCGVSVSARQLQQHIRIKHDPNYVRPKPKPRETPLVCEDCGTFTTTMYSRLVRHRAREHRVANKSCPHCDQKFAMRGDLNRHVRYVHGGLNQAVGSCPHCGKKISRKNLAAHIKMVHEKRRPHACTICGRAFLTKYTLQQHMDTHKPTGQRGTRFLCAYCGKGFLNRTHYSDHLNTHTGARPYVCEVCNKTFRCNPALHKHRELHRPVSLHCTTCDLHFPSRKALRIHNNKEHLQAGTHQRCVCGAEYNSTSTLVQHQARCGQWQQSHPQENAVAASMAVEPVTEAGLDGQMRVVFHPPDTPDLQQSVNTTYLVVEGKEGGETVMVLQGIDNMEEHDIANVLGSSQIITLDGGGHDNAPQTPQTVTATTASVLVEDGTEIMTLSGSEVKTIADSEVLARLSSANMMAVSHDNLQTVQVIHEGGGQALLELAGPSGEEEGHGGEGEHEITQVLHSGEPRDPASNLLVPETMELVERTEGETTPPPQREDLNRYLCGCCQQLFTNLEDVQTHMMAEHVGLDGGDVELALHTPATGEENDAVSAQSLDDDT